MSERFLWLDVAKGIAIILMVLGHTAIPECASNFIYAFHMPLFFIASGFTTNWNKNSFKDFFLRKSHSLLIPFLLYSTIVLMVQYAYLDVDVLNIFCNGWGGLALWFIPVLFFALILIKIFNRGCRALICVGLLCISSLLCYYKVFLPWNLSSIFIASFFILVGSIFNDMKVMDKILKAKYLLIYFILTCLISSKFRLDIAWNQVNPILLLIISAMSGTLMIFALSKLLEKHINSLAKLLTCIGKETYVILAFSQTIIMILNHYFSFSSLFKYCILVVVIYLIITVKNTLSLLFSKLLNKK